MHISFICLAHLISSFSCVSEPCAPTLFLFSHCRCAKKPETYHFDWLLYLLNCNDYKISKRKKGKRKGEEKKFFFQFFVKSNCVVFCTNCRDSLPKLRAGNRQILWVAKEKKKKKTQRTRTKFFASFAGKSQVTTKIILVYGWLFRYHVTNSYVISLSV